MSESDSARAKEIQRDLYRPNPGMRGGGPAQVGTSTPIAQGGSYADMAARMPDLADIAFQLRGTGGPAPYAYDPSAPPDPSTMAGELGPQPQVYTRPLEPPAPTPVSRTAPAAAGTQPPADNAKFKFLVSTGISPVNAAKIISATSGTPLMDGGMVNKGTWR